MLNECDRSRAVDVVYLDFRKAFKLVPHKRLMRKVHDLGNEHPRHGHSGLKTGWEEGGRGSSSMLPSDWTAVSSEWCNSRISFEAFLFVILQTLENCTRFGRGLLPWSRTMSCSWAPPTKRRTIPCLFWRYPALMKKGFRGLSPRRTSRVLNNVLLRSRRCKRSWAS